MNENGLARAVIFRERLYDRLFLRQQAALEIKLRSDVLAAKVVLLEVLQNEKVQRENRRAVFGIAPAQNRVEIGCQLRLQAEPPFGKKASKPRRARALVGEHTPARTLLRYREHLEITTYPRRFGSMSTPKDIVARLDSGLRLSPRSSRRRHMKIGAGGIL